MKEKRLTVKSTSHAVFPLALPALILLATVHIAAAEQQSSLSVTLTRSGRDGWDYFSQVVAPLGTIGALVAAILTLWWSVRNWKWTYFTKEWSTLVQFVQPQAKFMDPSLTANYKTSFTGEDAMKYELIARLCIGYLDDLYFLGSKRQFRTWFRGSGKLFAGTHRKWLTDHQDSYDQGFYKFIVSQLDRAS